MTPEPRTDAELQLFATSIIEHLKQIDRMSADLKPDDHPDYNRTLILAKLRASWSPR